MRIIKNINDTKFGIFTIIICSLIAALVLHFYNKKKEHLIIAIMKTLMILFSLLLLMLVIYFMITKDLTTSAILGIILLSILFIYNIFFIIVYSKSFLISEYPSTFKTYKTFLKSFSNTNYKKIYDDKKTVVYQNDSDKQTKIMILTQIKDLDISKTKEFIEKIKKSINYDFYKDGIFPNRYPTFLLFIYTETSLSNRELAYLLDKWNTKFYPIIITKETIKLVDYSPNFELNTRELKGKALELIYPEEKYKEIKETKTKQKIKGSNLALNYLIAGLPAILFTFINFTDSPNNFTGEIRNINWAMSKEEISLLEEKTQDEIIEDTEYDILVYNDAVLGNYEGIVRYGFTKDNHLVFIQFKFNKSEDYLNYLNDFDKIYGIGEKMFTNVTLWEGYFENENVYFTAFDSINTLELSLKSINKKNHINLK